MKSLEDVAHAIDIAKWRYGSLPDGLRALKDSPEPLTNYQDVSCRLILYAYARGTATKLYKDARIVLPTESVLSNEGVQIS